MVKSIHCAPVAQWIERWPPEPKASVRVRPGVYQSSVQNPEQFLSMIRFDTR